VFLPIAALSIVYGVVFLLALDYRGSAASIPIDASLGSSPHTLASVLMIVLILIKDRIPCAALDVHRRTRVYDNKTGACETSDLSTFT